MQDLKDRINESFFSNIGAAEGRLWETYVYHDGFQFGWSEGISDTQWFPIFDMNFVRNFYQKYMDPEKLKRGLCPEFISNHGWKFKKYERNSKGEKFFGYCHHALVFAILSAKCLEPNEKDIKFALSKFLNKENGADKDTEIKVLRDNTYAYGGGKSYKIYIKNDRVGYVSRPLWIELLAKDDINKFYDKQHK